MKSPASLRAELALLRARYDSGAVSPGVYAVIKALETGLAWHEHHNKRNKEVVGVMRGALSTLSGDNT